MIDLLFEHYSECLFTEIRERRRSRVGQWTHIEVDFKYISHHEDANQLGINALLILNLENELSHIVLHQDGKESIKYKFTENEKRQIIKWYDSKQAENNVKQFKA